VVRSAALHHRSGFDKMGAGKMQCGLVRGALLLVACAASVYGDGSKLKVAACDSFWPFVGVGADSQLTGFDVEFWRLLYAEMKSMAKASPDATVLAALGDTAPTIQVMARDAVLKGVQDGSVDVGLCGFQIDAAQHVLIDYSPALLSSGYRALVQAAEPDLNGVEVLKGALRGFNESSFFAILMLVSFSIIHAHILYALERKENMHISGQYGWGVFDAWWLSMVTALTVGYGDKVPVTFLGRLLVVGWMFIGTYCVLMFGAAVTSDFLTKASGQGEGSSLLGLESIAHLDRSMTVGTVDAFSRQYVADAVPGINVTQFVDTAQLLAALAEGVVQVAVDEQWHARWLIQHDDRFKTQNLIPVGETFSSKAHVLAISRPVQAGGGRGSHAILHTLNQAVANLMFGSRRGAFEAIYNAWMLKHPPKNTVSYSAALKMALIKWNTIYSLGSNILCHIHIPICHPQVSDICTPGSTNKRCLCSREHKQAKLVLPGAQISDICALGSTRK
jgi:ABC-type amino acid transport substrate-binding protein